MPLLYITYHTTHLKYHYRHLIIIVVLIIDHRPCYMKYIDRMLWWRWWRGNCRINIHVFLVCTSQFITADCLERNRFVCRVNIKLLFTFSGKVQGFLPKWVCSFHLIILTLWLFSFTVELNSEQWVHKQSEFGRCSKRTSIEFNENKFLWVKWVGKGACESINLFGLSVGCEWNVAVCWCNESELNSFVFGFIFMVVMVWIKCLVGMGHGQGIFN